MKLTVLTSSSRANGYLLHNHSEALVIEIIIKANYADDILEDNILKGLEHPSKRERLLTSHMELETTKAVLMAQDLSRVQNIILAHLSDLNTDEARFVDDIKALTGKHVYAAKAGLSIDLNL